MFSAGVFANLLGLLPEGPTAAVPGDPHNVVFGAWGERSIAGALLAELFLPEPGGSDPARPRPGTVGAGELDLLEWFLLNHPAPPRGLEDEAGRRARARLADWGCTACHVPDWEIRAAASGALAPGDRRFFHLEIARDPASGAASGRLVPLTGPAPGGGRLAVPRRGAFRVRDLYSDLRHHDLGPSFWEIAWSEGRPAVTRAFKTAPLWGVGSTAPYGHDGASPTLDAVIRRHGGEADGAAAAYAAATQSERDAALRFLGDLVLVRPEGLPADLDGDGEVAADWRRDGRSLGPEVFRAELLFREAPRYRGRIEGPSGDANFSYELLDLERTYRLGDPGLADRDGDAVPDVLRIPPAAGAR